MGNDQPESLNEEDLIVLLATKINSVNAKNYDQLVYTTQFDTEEPETYARAIPGPNVTKWAKAMENVGKTQALFRLLWQA